MLVLSRRPGEKVMIGDTLVVTINRVAGNRVVLGIEAPEPMPVVRGELISQEAGGDAPGTNTGATEDSPPLQ